MALRLAGEEIGVQEKLETISYSPQIQNSGDLEGATKTITAVAEASGVVNADYSASLTLPKPASPYLMVRRIASRLAVTIDSMTAGNLYCRVYVDQQDADHRLFDEGWTTTGAKLDAVDTHSGNKAAIFNLLADGNAHTFYFFFWVNSGNAVISVVQLWEGVGHCGGGPDTEGRSITINHIGFATVVASANRVGTGTWTIGISLNEDVVWSDLASSVSGRANSTGLFTSKSFLFTYGTVATDLNYIDAVAVNLRTE